MPLGDPDVLVCSVGTEIFFEPNGAPEANKDWAAELDQGWNRPKAIEIAGSFPELSPQVHGLCPPQDLTRHAIFPSIGASISHNCSAHNIANINAHLA